MTRLTRSDTEAMVAFSGELMAAASDRERADRWIVERLARLVDADFAGYTEIEKQAGAYRIVHDAEYPGPSTPPPPELGFQDVQNPFCAYVERSGDLYFTARRVSDVTQRPAFVRPSGAQACDGDLPHDIQTRMPGTKGSHWTLEVARDGRDFSNREVLLVDGLRPSLVAYEAHRVLAAEIRGLVAVAGEADALTSLSRRENEVLDLVARGWTNAEIGEALWISPGTVRKHLDNIYFKLEVRTRTAALARTGRVSALARPR